jgi:hypothetical protein
MSRHRLSQHVLGAACAALVAFSPTVVGAQDAPTPVSMVRLLANPEAYDGQAIQVTGFLVLEFENQALYLSRDVAELNLFAESIWVTFDERLLPAAGGLAWNRHAAMLEGTFDADDRGHMGLFSGQLSVHRAVCEPSTPFGCDALSEEQARELAAEAGAAAGYDLDSYQIVSTTRQADGRWLVTFEHTPPAPPGAHFGVFVDAAGAIQLMPGE